MGNLRPGPTALVLTLALVGCNHLQPFRHGTDTVGVDAHQLESYRAARRQIDRVRDVRAERAGDVAALRRACAAFRAAVAAEPPWSWEDESEWPPAGARDLLGREETMVCGALQRRLDQIATAEREAAEEARRAAAEAERVAEEAARKAAEEAARLRAEEARRREAEERAVRERAEARRLAAEAAHRARDERCREQLGPVASRWEKSIERKLVERPLAGDLLARWFSACDHHNEFEKRRCETAKRAYRKAQRRGRFVTGRPVTLGRYDFKRKRFPVELDGVLTTWNNFAVTDGRAKLRRQLVGDVPVRGRVRTLRLSVPDLDDAEWLRNHGRLVWMGAIRVSGTWRHRAVTRLEAMMRKQLTREMRQSGFGDVARKFRREPMGTVYEGLTAKVEAEALVDVTSGRLLYARPKTAFATIEAVGLARGCPRAAADLGVPVAALADRYLELAGVSPDASDGRQRNDWGSEDSELLAPDERPGLPTLLRTRAADDPLCTSGSGRGCIDSIERAAQLEQAAHRWRGWLPETLAASFNHGGAPVRAWSMQLEPDSPDYVVVVDGACFSAWRPDGTPVVFDPPVACSPRDQTRVAAPVALMHEGRSHLLLAFDGQSGSGLGQTLIALYRPDGQTLRRVGIDELDFNMSFGDDAVSHTRDASFRIGASAIVVRRSHTIGPPGARRTPIGGVSGVERYSWVLEDGALVKRMTSREADEARDLAARIAREEARRLDGH